MAPWRTVQHAEPPLQGNGGHGSGALGLGGYNAPTRPADQTATKRVWQPTTL
jgi:hypothetical protein